jgi:hypothetical protein
MPAKIKSVERDILEADLALRSLHEDVVSHLDDSYTRHDSTKERLEEAQRRLSEFSKSFTILVSDVAWAVDRRSSLEADARLKAEEAARLEDCVQRAAAVDGLVKTSEDELSRLEEQMSATTSLLSRSDIEAFTAAQIDPIQAHLDELLADMGSLSPNSDEEARDEEILSSRFDAVFRLRARASALIGLSEALGNKTEGRADSSEDRSSSGQLPEKHSAQDEISDEGDKTQMVQSADVQVVVISDGEAEAIELPPEVGDSTISGHTTEVPSDIDDIHSKLDDVLSTLPSGNAVQPDVVLPQVTSDQVEEAERKLHELHANVDAISDLPSGVYDQATIDGLRAELRSKSDVVLHHRRVAEFVSATNSLDSLMSTLLESIDRAEDVPSRSSYFRGSQAATPRSASTVSLPDVPVTPSSSDPVQLSNAVASMTSQLEAVEAAAKHLEGHTGVAAQVGRLREACGEMALMARDRLEHRQPGSGSSGPATNSSSRPRTLSSASSSSLSPLTSRKQPRPGLPKRIPSCGLDKPTMIPRSASTGSARSMGSSSSLSQLTPPSNLSPVWNGGFGGFGATGNNAPRRLSLPRAIRRVSSVQSLSGIAGPNRYRPDRRAVDRVVGRVVNDLGVRLFMYFMGSD